MPNDDYQWQVNNQPLPSWVQPLIANQQPIAASPIPIEGTPADRAAYTVARGVTHSFKQPVADDRGHPFAAINPERPSYIMEPDLQETQLGMELPPSITIDDGGYPRYVDNNERVPVIKRPGLLPLAMSPEGLKVVMPKMLDIASNVMGNVGGKVAVKGGEMVLGSGLVRTAQEAKAAEPFYSQLERTVQQSKINLATPEQWLGYLKNQPGVKTEELNLVLGQLPKEGMLSKAQLEDYVKQNKVELKEKVLGGSGERLKELQNKVDNSVKLNDTEFKEYNELLKNKFSTQYHPYQLPGGENYKETLLSLPGSKEKEALVNQSNKLRERRDEIDKILSSKRNSLTDDEVLKLAKEKIDGYDEQKILAKKLDAVENTEYKALHFDEHGTNLIGHLRTNERIIGNKVGTHIEEIQSDWGQGIRKHGYKGEKEKLQPEFDKIEKKIIDSNDETIMGQPKIESALKMAVERGIINSNESGIYKRYTDIENGKPLPDMPFKKNWDKMLLKRAIHDAAVKGHDFISWTPGEAQVTNPKNLGQTGEKAEKSNEGMKGFYDKILVDRANSIGKKYGSKVEQKEIGIPHKAGIQGSRQPIHYMEITPELRQKAKEGFSLFSSSPTLTPVTQAPQFDSQEKPKYRLTPVQGNPFQ